jgi:predicted glycogen debranching enzyme
MDGSKDEAMLTLRKTRVSPIQSLDVQEEALEDLLTQEWLLTNARGGYCSSTIAGCNTRAYHGLLVGSLQPPVCRVVALANVLETVAYDGQSYELSTSEFNDRFAPAGHTYLKQWSRDIGVHFAYELGRARVTRSVYLAREADVVALLYTVDAIKKPLELTVRPFVGLRDFHTLQNARAPLCSRRVERGVLVRHNVPDSCQLVMASEQAQYEDSPQWWHQFVYRCERERGQAFTEDLWTPGVFKITLKKPGQFVVWAHLQGHDGPGIAEPFDLNEIREDLVDHQREIVAAGGAGRRVNKALCVAADQFVARRTTAKGQGTTIMAGYPWFADWGRDAFVALPGLLLDTGRVEQAKQVLLTFAESADQGMIPNCFDEHDNTAHYDSIDASLWFIHAAFRYLQVSEDNRIFTRDLMPVIRWILDSYQKGTRFGIHADTDGLITAGPAPAPLTWMDARCGDTVFTARHGKAVEVNALWHNALSLVSQYYARRDRQSSQSYKALAAQVGESFVARFWNDATGYLNDVIAPDGTADSSLRPNQIFAISLPYAPPLSAEQQASILEKITQRLLTPYGLRTLDPGHPSYRGVYTGSRYERDGAYHQGTVWPYLIGPFVEAYIRVNGEDRKARLRATAFLETLLDHLTAEGCLGSLCEVFDGDEPARPKGCIAQAWSVAELIRAYRIVNG